MPASNLLSDKAVNAAIKAAVAAGKSRRIADGAGLYLDARATGSGWWRFRFFVSGKENMLSLGVYPDVTLKQAREKRDAARSARAAGADPAEMRKAEKTAGKVKAHAKKLEAEGKPAPGTFEAVAREWLTTVHEIKVSDNHATRTRVRFEQDVFPWLGREPIAEIEAPALLACLRRVLARGAIETTHRIKDACGQVFRFGIASGYCKRDVAADLRDALPPVPTRHHASIVEPKRAAELLRAMTEYKGTPATKDALHLSALLFLRPGELRQLEWSWIDLDDGVLSIPSNMMKRSKNEKATGAPHFVPLAPQAVAILRERHVLSGHGRYVFPSLLTGERPMSENTVRSALRRMGYGDDDMSAHGFRAMARTMADERLGIAPEVIEAQLAHAVPDALGRAYNRTTFLAQRRELMVRWANYIDQLREGAKTTSAQAH